MKFDFNIEVPEIKIYNQYGSCQCNIYAFIRVVKDVLRKNTDLNVDELDLSANYINFYDKLEKVNALYDDLIASTDLSLEEIRCKVDQYIGNFGTFHFCREIMNKYGMVPTEYMDELGEDYDDGRTIELLRDRVKCDAASLLDVGSRDEKASKKKELTRRAYQLLVEAYGTPPTEFEFGGELLAPGEFKERYLGNLLDEYVAVTTFAKETLMESQAYIPEVYTRSEDILVLSVDEIEKAIVEQLRDGVSVWFSAEVSTVAGYKDGVLDDGTYERDELSNVRNISRDEKLLLDIINYDHAMCITGALVEGSEVKQFKVDDSFGGNGKYGGRLIMTEGFFRNYVITAIVNRKYLSELSI